MQLVEKLLAVLFPPKRECLFCGAAAGHDGLCRSCERRMVARQGFLACPLCGRFRVVGALGDPEHLCAECCRRPPVYEAARSLGPYTGTLKEAIYLYKYQGLRSLTDFFGLRLAEVFVREPAFHGTDTLVPVPLSREKLMIRGFNQSELLAASLGEALNLPVRMCLTRTRNTPSQSKLTGKARRENIRGAFALNAGDLTAATVTLVDDIVTTGATVEECANVLIRAGVKKVTVLSLASGIQENINNRG